MLNEIRNAVDMAASAASDGEITSLQVDAAPPGKGDCAIRLGPLARATKRPLPELGSVIARAIADLPCIASTTLEGPFVNLQFNIDALARAATRAIMMPDIRTKNPQRIMVEYLSPNTNKPLHLGHLRNGVLGSTLSSLLSAIGHTVIRSELINDRGEHICKSMLGYLRHGNGATPTSIGQKGDHFVGDMYVAYMKDDRVRRDRLQAEAAAEIDRWAAGNARVRELVASWKNSKSSKDKERAQKQLLALIPPVEERSIRLVTDWKGPDPEVESLLKRWEADDPEVLSLWRTMNGWVYDGFAVTKPRFGFHFDKLYYESELYTLGKEQVLDGLKRGVFLTDAGGAVLFDLPIGRYGTNQDGDAHRRKVLNANGTSVYLTQDIGTAILKAEEFNLDRSIYVVANEQDPHFMALFAILRALGYPWADRCHQLSYAMVLLPHGRMKSREGTTVDADDLADEMAVLAANLIRDREPTLDEAEIARRAEVIGLAAIKFYLARPSPTSDITFDPERGLSFEGDTGPYVLYTYARANSVLKKARERGLEPADPSEPFVRLGNQDERACLLEILRFPEGVQRAAERYAPSILVERLFALCGTFNRFYKNHHVIHEDTRLTQERLTLVQTTAEALRWGLSLFGVTPLESM